MKEERYARIARPGDLKWSMMTVDHEAWLLLDGRTIKAADHPVLFDALGIVAASYVLPDARGRTLIGSGGSLAMGQTGGGDRMTIALANLPAHGHEFTDASVDLTVGKALLSTGILPLVSGGKATSARASTEKAGGGQPISVPLPPFIAFPVFVFAGRRP